MDRFLINWLEALVYSYIIQGQGKHSHTTINKTYDYEPETNGAIAKVELTLAVSYVLDERAPANMANINSFETEFNKQRENIAYNDNYATGILEEFSNEFNKGVGQIVRAKFTYETYK